MRTYNHTGKIAVAALAAGALWGQTRIHLQTQGKAVDFSSATSTRPAKTGTSLPATCVTGEVYFKTDAAAGANWYGCTATNTWTLLGGGAVASVHGRTGAVVAQEGDYSLADLADVSAKQGNASTVQMFGGGAVAANDCARFDANGNVVSAGAPCGSGSGATIAAGLGITATTSGSVTTVAVDAAVVPTMLTATATLTPGSVGAGACVENDLALNGAATGDAVAAGWPADFPAGLVGMAFVNSANNVRLRICNPTGSQVAVGSSSFRATIVRGF